MRGRKRNTPAEETAAKLEELMARAGWSQTKLAKELSFSSSTVSRVLGSKAASKAFIQRAERMLQRPEPEKVSGRSQSPHELHLLQEMYGLLKTVSGRIEELAVESRERERKEGHR